MLYLLLIIVIILLLIIVYRGRDKGAYFRNLLERNAKLNPLQEFKVDDPRNETHPEEMVKTKNGDLSTRKLAVLLYKMGKQADEIAKERIKD